MLNALIPIIMAQCVVPYGFEPELILALVKVESNFDAAAIGDEKKKEKSFGLGQVQLRTARDMGFQGELKDLFIPEENLKYSCKYLAYLYSIKKNINESLRCYNLGLSACGKSKWRKPWDKHRYVGKIIRAKRKIIEGG